MKLLGLSAAFLTTILAANYATTEWGLISPAGVTMTAGTLFAGLAFVLRDSVNDAGGVRLVVALIVAGGLLSFLVAAPFIAAASAVAFLLSELADLAVYSPLRRRGYLRAAVASNVVGSVVDTFVFLWVAGFPLWPAVPGQLVGKLAVTVVLVLVVGGVRVALLRKPVFS